MFFDKKSQAGFSLIEILVVLTIVASIVGMAVSSLNGLSTTRQMKNEAIKLFSRIKYVYEQAASQNLYQRLVFNLDEQTYFVEASNTPFYVVKEGDQKEALRLENEERDRDSFDSEDSESAPPPPDFVESDDDLMEIFKLPDLVKLADVYVMHQKDKVSEGIAYLYFFPRGQTEFAVLHLADVENEDNVMTLIVNPLTGVVEMREGRIEHQEISDEMNGNH